MELIKNKIDCSGCAMCYNICPKRAIQMVEDENGYIYPKVNEEKCVNCGLCKKSCAYQIKDKNLNKPVKTYVATSKNDNLIKKSASGAIFASIAEEFIKKNGIVYGASMEKENDLFIVKHIRVNKLEELSKLQGSKYVQSDTSKIYQPIKNDLESGAKVLFSGTPCQVDALKSYLNKQYENLFTIDLICHGVPNSRMFNDYIKMLEKHENSKLIDFTFRDKAKGWGLYASYNIKKNNKILKKVKPSYEMSYYQLFLDSKIYRENCYSCPYAKEQRVGDITIGDFWKVESEHPEYLDRLNIKKGVSCTLVNTDRGKKILSDFSKNILLLDSELEKVKRHNKQLIKPSELSEERNIILNLYNRNGYEAVNSYYLKKQMKKILLKKLWYKIPSKIRNKIK